MDFEARGDLRGSVGASGSPAGRHQEQLEDLVLIEIFVAPEGCPSCGKAQRLVGQVAPDYPGVEVREVHILDAPERVVAYGVFTTPFIVIDGTVEFVGLPREKDLRARIGAKRAGS
jgi:glutaredoxin